MTTEKRDELKRLHTAATQGEWKATLPRSGRWQISNGRVQVAAVWSTTGNPGKDVAECIAALHNAFPDLIAALEAAEARAEAAEKDAEIARGSRAEIMAQYELLSRLCKATEERERGWIARAEKAEAEREELLVYRDQETVRRAKADCYDRICDYLGIKSNVIGAIDDLRARVAAQTSGGAV